MTAEPTDAAGETGASEELEDMEVSKEEADRLRGGAIVSGDDSEDASGLL